MEEGDPLGATPNDKLVIIKVQPGTLAEGHLKVGDQVIKVNGTMVRDNNHFYQLLRFAPPLARITVVRDHKKAEELEAKMNIPEDRARFIQRRDGYNYQLVKFDWKRDGRKIGLGIKHYQNRVLVSRIDPGSLAQDYLALGDHVIDIDSRPVTDKDVAREFLIKGLTANGFVTMVVERPESMEAKHWITSALNASSVQPPSVAMNEDVCQIAARQRERVNARQVGTPQKPILAQGTRKTNRRVAINDKIAEVLIQSDNENRVLKPVRK